MLRRVDARQHIDTINENTELQRQLRDERAERQKLEMTMRSLKGDLATSMQRHEKQITELQQEVHEARLAAASPEQRQVYLDM